MKEAKVSAAELAEMARGNVPMVGMLAKARILKLGKRLAVGEVLLHGGNDEDLVAHVTSTYSIPPHDPVSAG